MNSDGDWNKYQIYILKELEKLNRRLDVMEKDIQHIKVEVNTLKTKAAMWGVLAGAIVTIIGYILNWDK